jgi:DNA-binding protein H-NS
MTTYRQLKQQIAQLEKKAAIAMKEEVRKAIESIKQQIAEFGLTAADLGLKVARRAGARTAKGKKLALAPKYRDPSTGKTWNGHGKRPAWIVAAQKKGKLEELAIAASSLAKAPVKPAVKKTQKKPAAVAKPAVKKAQKKPAPAARPTAKQAPKKPVAPLPEKRTAAPKAAAKKPAAKKPAPTKTAPPATKPQPAVTPAATEPAVAT